MLKCSDKEIKFLESLEEVRIATYHDYIPHVKPVSYIFYKDCIVVATDYKTRSFQNIKKNPNTGIVIDQYKPGEHKAICIQGETKIIESGSEFKELYDIFYKKFAWVRKDPWKEKEAPFLKIIPTSKVSWGLD